LGCSGNGSTCTCARTKLDALDSAIEAARINPWGGDSLRKPSEAAPRIDAA